MCYGFQTDVVYMERSFPLMKVGLTDPHILVGSESQGK